MNEDARDARRAAEAPKRRWRAAAAVLAGVIGLSLLLASESLEASRIFDVTLHYPGIDKIAHLVQYALVFLAVWWMLGVLAVGHTARATAAALIALMLGIVDEVFQGFVAGAVSRLPTWRRMRAGSSWASAWGRCCRPDGRLAARSPWP